MNTYDTLLDTLKVIGGYKTTEADIYAKTAEAVTLATKLVKEQKDEAKVAAAIKAIPDAAAHIATYKQTIIAPGTVLRNTIENDIDMARGCMNRICITDDPKECASLYDSLLHHINKLCETSLYEKGYLQLVVKNWWE